MTFARDLSQLKPPATQALGVLILSMADDEFVLGFSDSEWTGIAPILEEDVAMSSLAQDELGHAQALYGLLADLVRDGRTADALAYDRPPAGYLHARLLDHPRGDWARAIVRRFLYDTADSFRLGALASSAYAPLADLVGKLRREERYHVMHATTWFERLATADGEPRERLLAALELLGPDAGSVLTPLPNERGLLDDAFLAEPFGALEARWREQLGASVRASRPATAAPDPRAGPGSDVARRGVHVAAWRVHRRPPARSRGGLVIAEPMVTVDAVHAALADVRDPEIPAISIVDLGIVHDVSVSDGAIRVDLLPTFVGCPALDAIRDAVELRLARFGRPVDVRFVFTVPWTSERITSAGREALRRSGFAPPTGSARHRFAARRPRRARPVPVLRLDPDSPRQRLRPGAVPLDPLLHRLPPAVRAVQGRLTIDDFAVAPGSDRVTATGRTAWAG